MKIVKYQSFRQNILKRKLSLFLFAGLSTTSRTSLKGPIFTSSKKWHSWSFPRKFIQSKCSHLGQSKDCRSSNPIHSTPDIQPLFTRQKRFHPIKSVSCFTSKKYSQLQCFGCLANLLGVLHWILATILILITYHCKKCYNKPLTSYLCPLVYFIINYTFLQTLELLL